LLSVPGSIPSGVALEESLGVVFSTSRLISIFLPQQAERIRVWLTAASTELITPTANATYVKTFVVACSI